jgi:ribosomal protein L10
VKLYDQLYEMELATKMSSHDIIQTFDLTRPCRYKFKLIRYTWVFFLHDKSEVASIFKKFAKKAQNEFDCKIGIMNIAMKLGSSMKYLQHIHLNKMEL